MHLTTTLRCPALFLVSLTAMAAEVPDKPAGEKTYSALFRPVAIEDRRALSIDRSNFTYSPSGLNSGVLQLETSVVEYTRDTHIPGVDGELSQFTFGTLSVRLGLTDDVELQTIITSHVSARFKDAAGAVTKDNGLGDTLLQGRYTISGNHGEKVGFGILPYLKLPTNTLDSYNDKLEGGVQAPVSYTISERFCTVASGGFDVNYNGSTAHSYDVNPFVSGVIWYTAVPDTLYLFTELYLKKNTGTGSDDLTSYAGFGGVWQLGRDCGIDFGLNAGLSEVAPDLYVRTGFTYRF